MHEITESYKYIIIYLSMNLSTLSVLKWTGTGAAVLGGLVFSIFIEASTWIFPYLLFLYAHIVWFLAATIYQDRPLWWLNVGALPIDVYALTIRTIQ